MQELIQIDSVPAKVAVNFEELKAALERDLEKYRVVVTADTVADAKKLSAELNKTAAAIDERRKEAVAEVSAPVREFDENMRSLVKLCKDGRAHITEQVKKFEDETRAKAQCLLEKCQAELWEKHGIENEFRQSEIGDLVLISNVTKTGSLTAKAKLILEERVLQEKALQEKTQMRLLELENHSYRAGLSAPLTRVHVAGFLFADDSAYQTGLDRIIEAEKKREEEAQRRMRERMAREQAEREQAEREAKARKSEAADITPGPTLQTHDPDPSEPGYREPIKETLLPGRYRVEVTAVFRTEIRAEVTDEAIEKELRRVMKKAGINALRAVTISRLQA
jgi:hypothetical protein